MLNAAGHFLLFLVHPVLLFFDFFSGSKRLYTKPAKSAEEQWKLLRERGMQPGNMTHAQILQVLERINYYRLAGYWKFFEREDSDEHRFNPNTNFKEVLNLYNFDVKLRILLFDAIQPIEIALRTQWANQFALQHSPHAYLERSLAQNAKRWRLQVCELKRNIAHSKEQYAIHNREKYREKLPPLWVGCEAMSIGLLSRFYHNSPLEVKRLVASHFGIPQGIFASWIRHLSEVRNHVAHHNRCWNRIFSIPPRLRSPEDTFRFNAEASGKIYNTLLILLHLIEFATVPASHANVWRNQVYQHMNKFSYLSEMGFPRNWRTVPPWQTIINPNASSGKSNAH